MEKARERSHVLYGLGVDLMDYSDSYHTTISTLLNSVFNEEGTGWIDWYLYERPGFSSRFNSTSLPLTASDKNGNEICHNIQSLWDTIKHTKRNEA